MTAGSPSWAALPDALWLQAVAQAARHTREPESWLAHCRVLAALEGTSKHLRELLRSDAASGLWEHCILAPSYPGLNGRQLPALQAWLEGHIYRAEHVTVQQDRFEHDLHLRAALARAKCLDHLELQDVHEVALLQCVSSQALAPLMLLLMQVTSGEEITSGLAQSGARVTHASLQRCAMCPQLPPSVRRISVDPHINMQTGWSWYQNHLNDPERPALASWICHCINPLAALEDIELHLSERWVRSRGSSAAAADLR